MSSIKKLLARMTAEQVPQEEGPIEEKSKKSGGLPPKQELQAKIRQAPRPKTQRKQSQKGG